MTCKHLHPTSKHDDAQDSSKSAVRYCVKYPHIAPAIAKVACLVANLRAQPNAELEARLGLIEPGGRFRAGISRQEIDRLIQMMEKSSHVKGEPEWVEEQDFLFSVSGKDSFRTRVRYTSDNLSVQPHTVCKDRLGDEDFRVVCESGLFKVPDIRISLKTEDPVLAVPTCTQTLLVRIKQRRRFVTADGCWAFDFAMSWSAPTKTEAESKQATSDPVFEVECELIDAEQVLASHTDSRIATSLLLKICDMLPPHAKGKNGALFKLCDTGK